MEYIKKEELIKGEVYRHENENLVQYLFDSNDTQIHGYFIGDKRNVFRNYNDTISKFTINKLKLATPEEKHWLESCITANKFIEFDEAMKTFIPEYVEWVGNIGSENLGYQTQYTFEKNKIFKTDTELPLAGFQTENWLKHLTVYPNNYKPSTKEAYDAQFVIKEPEFVLPEKWYISIAEDVDKSIRNWFNEQNKVNIYTTTGSFLYLNWCGSATGDHLTHYIRRDHIQITFEQFKKYILKEEIVEEVKVIEPLPQFKVIETIETITKVENNEGNQFFIGDKVKLGLLLVVHNIIGFKYNEDKTKILAITNWTSTGIDINEIEHYIETKVEFILPEKWCIKNIDDLIGDYFNNKVNSKCYTIDVHKNCYLHSLNLQNQGLISSSNKSFSEPYRRNNFTEITFDQFKKYVLKEEKLSPIQLANIEHPELAIVEESLLDKAKRLYPVGTKFINPNDNKECIIKEKGEYFKGNNNIYHSLKNDIYQYEEGLSGCIYINNRWSKIIEYPHGFKIGDNIKLKLAINPETHKIIKIEGNDLFYNFKNKEFKILAKNAIKVG